MLSLPLRTYTKEVLTRFVVIDKVEFNLETLLVTLEALLKSDEPAKALGITDAALCRTLTTHGLAAIGDAGGWYVTDKTELKKVIRWLQRKR